MTTLEFQHGMLRSKRDSDGDHLVSCSCPARLRGFIGSHSGRCQCQGQGHTARTSLCPHFTMRSRRVQLKGRENGQIAGAADCLIIW